MGAPPSGWRRRSTQAPSKFDPWVDALLVAQDEPVSVVVETAANNEGATGTQRIRACLIDLPVMLEEIVREALRAVRVEIVADPSSLVSKSAADEVAVIITAQPAAGALQRFRSLLHTAPDIAILAVAESGRGATLWQLWPVERTLGELSESLIVGIVQAITPWNVRMAAARHSSLP